MKVTRIIATLPLVILACAHAPVETGASIETISITGPLIVAFLPPFTAEQSQSDAAVEAEAHVQFALSDAQRCLGQRPVPIRVVHAKELVVVDSDGRTSLRIPDDWPHAVGAYLFDRGRRPCVVYATGGPSSLQMTLPAAAGEYFSEPGCPRDGAGKLCNEHDG